VTSATATDCALVAGPLKSVAVMFRAMKSPLESRATIALAVFAAAAVVAELATLPAVVIAARKLSAICEVTSAVPSNAWP
jgi:hypothetical protein